MFLISVLMVTVVKRSGSRISNYSNAGKADKVKMDKLYNRNPTEPSTKSTNSLRL